MAHTYGFMMGHNNESGMLFEYFPVEDLGLYTKPWIKQNIWRYTEKKLSYLEQKGRKLAKMENITQSLASLWTPSQL